MMKIYKKAILPQGFKASAVAAGIKKSGKLDLALLYSEIPAKAACQFTANTMAAAPVKVSQEHLKNNRQFQAIIVNSGNANCFTGNPGLRDANETTKMLAKALNIKKKSILVASTGIIGKRLPVNNIKKAIPELITGLSTIGIGKAKIAVMTTDTFPKEITVKFNINRQIVTVCGVAKGAGMIAPNMATMLCFILTDANITQMALNKALKTAIDNSFNCITVDGCMSTNDSVIALANGAAKNGLIDRGRNFDSFVKALRPACLELAKMIVRDAEGATKFIKIEVNGAKNFKEARNIALNIANSSLFKTAMYGENPNFGRIAAAVGATGIRIRQGDLKIKVSPLQKKEIMVNVRINRGKSDAVVYTSDLTPEYVRINAEYN